MRLNKQQILTLQAICQKGIACKRQASIWLRALAEEEGFGKVSGRSIEITAADIRKIVTFLETNGYSGQTDESTFLNRMTTAKVFSNEKLTRGMITSNRILLKSVKNSFCIDGKTFPPGHAIEFKTSELTQCAVSQIILIENLEPFLEAEHYPILTDLLNEDALLVYRGGQGLFSAQGSQAFINSFKGETIGFFDYDPAGLCTLGIQGLNRLILPDIKKIPIKELLTSNREDRFFAQIKQYQGTLNTLPLKSPELQEHTKAIINHRLAIMQEALLSRNIHLVFSGLVKMN
ncbi:DUF7281 domain-containing protein [Thiomicrorhabdus cannonii]|uniref:DUF7281 domain-containing protein n=1 Tax=Thiomicrorhabdus cannonii TaxID=2748011 RepID=UPI0015BB6741|nr:hypothetical protein [Thiomicrorhabdus cannonii]